MVNWIIIVIALSIFQMLCYSLNCPEYYVYISTVLVLLAALGMLYRVYRKQRAGEKEKLKKELESLRKLASQ